MSFNFGFDKNFFFGFFNHGGANAVREPLQGPNVIDGVVQSNGFNTYQITNEPQAGTLQVYADGLLLREGPGKDFINAGLNIIFSAPPEMGVSLEAVYLKVQ